LSSFSLDTGVIVEYIDLAGSYHYQAKAIIENVLAGRLSAVIAHPTLVETYYVSTRIYKRIGVRRPDLRAEELVEWLYSSPNFTIAESSLKLAIEAGRIKERFRLALTDAYVLAASKLYKGKAVFRKREREMASRLKELSKKYDLVFLGDYLP